MQVYLRDGSAQTCCHTEIGVADQTFQSQYTDTGPTSPSADPITPGAWQGSLWSANFEVTGMTGPRKKSRRKRDTNPGSSALEEDALTTRPTRRYIIETPGRLVPALTPSGLASGRKVGELPILKSRVMEWKPGSPGVGVLTSRPQKRLAAEGITTDCMVHLSGCHTLSHGEHGTERGRKQHW